MRACGILIVSFLASLAACQGATESSIRADQLIGRSWVLESIDSDPLVGAGPRPQISFGNELKISGLAGCNRFFGSATLEQGRLVSGPLGTTMMACPPPQDELERKVLAVLSTGCEIELAAENESLTLRGSGHTLVYRPGEGNE